MAELTEGLQGLELTLKGTQAEIRLNGQPLARVASVEIKADANGLNTVLLTFKNIDVAVSADAEACAQLERWKAPNLRCMRCGYQWHESHLAGAVGPICSSRELKYQ